MALIFFLMVVGSKCCSHLKLAKPAQAFFFTAFTFFFHCSLSSKMTPRHFTTLLLSNIFLLTTTCTSIVSCSLFFLDSTSSCVFCTFRFSLFTFHLGVYCLKSFSRHCSRSLLSTFTPDTVVSSAYCLTLLDRIVSGRSCTYRINRSAPRIYPCGTPPLDCSSF